MSGSKSDIPGDPNRDKGKAPLKSNLQLDLNDFSPSKRPRTERSSPRPNPRISYLLLGPKEGECAKRTLAPSEADPTCSVLRIGHDYEHFVFLDIPTFIDVTSLEDSVRYRVFGEEKREYEMALSRVSIHGPTEVVHFSDWERIVRDHSLRAGDVVSFDRDLPSEAYCLTKTLNSYKVTSNEAKLYLSLTDAVILTDNPRIAEVPRDGKYSKDIDVFDRDNQQYRMTLNHNFGVGGSLGFCLGGGWNDFVMRHNLERGDQVVIYKILDSGVTTGYYHVLRYVSKMLKDFVRIMHGPVTAGGIPLADVSDQRRNIPSGAASDQITTLMTTTEKGGTRSFKTVSYQGRVYTLVVDGDQTRIFTLHPLSDQRRNIPLAAGGDQRRNIPLTADGDQSRDIPEGSSSSSLNRSVYSTNKTLEPRDVSETDPRLHLDALTEAKYLCDDPAPTPYPLGEFPIPLLVFDKDENPYSMLLSHFTSDDGVITHTLGGDWQKFVQVHGLRANDEITIYKVLDRGFHYYYIYKKNPVFVHPAGIE